MDFGNIGSIQYVWELNKWDSNKINNKGKAFLNKNRPELFKKCLNTFLERIDSKEGDIHLRYFYAYFSHLEDVPSFSLLIFPSSGEIDYILNKEGNFFTNIHKNPDPIIINDIQTGLYISNDRTDSHLYYGYNNKFMVPNRIYGVVLFRKNPVENKSQYENFEEFLNYKYK
jgi:hypothetical protein